MEYLRRVQSNQTVRLWGHTFQSGVFPGAVVGGVIGLVPGILLILVLTGDAYYINGSEVLGFIVMSVAAGALLGVCVGGACSAIAGGIRRRLRRT